jgi:hypothetical protein
MIEYAKLIHGAFGGDSTWQFVVRFAIGCAVAGGLLGFSRQGHQKR